VAAVGVAAHAISTNIRKRKLIHDQVAEDVKNTPENEKVDR
jgi:hypothetical protein